MTTTTDTLNFSIWKISLPTHRKDLLQLTSDLEEAGLQKQPGTLRPISRDQHISATRESGARDAPAQRRLERSPSRMGAVA